MAKQVQEAYIVAATRTPIGRSHRGFFRNMLFNGELRKWEAESGASISRLDPLISVNCFLDLDASNATIAEAGAELDRRIVVFEKARRSS